MYFASRSEAGDTLALQLANHKTADSVVIALSEGGVLVGAQIASYLHCPLMMLLMEDIKLPGESSVLGVVDQNGGFTYNDMYSTGELESFESEFRGHIEQQKMERWHQLNRLLGDGGILKEEIVKDKNVILVSDMLTSGISLIAASNFLKRISIQRLSVATALSSVSAVDTMHMLADEVHVLSVMDSLLGADHYFENSGMPDRETLIALLKKAITNWTE